MIKIVYLTALLLGLSATKVFATDLIIRLDNSTSAQVVNEWGESETIVPMMNIHKLNVFAPLESHRLIQTIEEIPGVKWVQEDHPVTKRASYPNDPRFAEQWALNNEANTDINAPEAWDVSKGGKDINGHDIVIAIVDGGMDLSHLELRANTWVNTGEVPGNQIDDDNNGYVDDINGWNAFENNGSIPAEPHGTHVAGIAGARGNDSSNVVGVNWNVKLMPIAGATGYTSTVLRAYGYALKQKQIWLDTGGRRGANVVVTNSSFGVDLAKCNTGSYPAWNDMYNELGVHGILSAAATINNSVNVDHRGDVPTACSSNYIIAVTNTTIEGKKLKAAGFGKINIDLGAPGTDVLSTVPRNRLDTYTGTSMATPHVAGAVAFLHSVASREFNNLYLNTPGQAALELKRILLDSVTPQEDLQRITVSGGRLNLHGAALRTAGFKNPN